MKTHTEQANDAVQAFETVRLELEHCRSELEACRARLRDLGEVDALRAGENRILEMVARGGSLAPILDALCRLVEEVSSDSLATILLLDAEGKRLWHAAAPSLPASYTEGMGGIVIGPSVGSCGTAAYRRAPVIVCDIATDPLWADYRDVALAHGLRASWSTPIFSSTGSLLGTFAILSREPRSPTAQHYRITEQITHLASIAIERHRTESALQANEARFRRMADAISQAIDTIPGLVWSVLPGGEVDFLNQRWREYTGMTLDQARGWGWRVAIHPEDRPRLEDYWRSVLASGKPGEIEARLRRFDGVHRWFLFRAVPLYDEAGSLVKWYGQNTDIDERKRAEALLAGEKRVLEMIVRGDALPRILDALCRLGEELTDGALVSILLVSADGKRLRHGAAPSLPERYIKAIDGGLIGPRAGSCGTAAYRKEPVVVSDIETDPLWTDYRHLALADDLRSCWSTPVFSTAREVLGTFALYSRQPAKPVPEHQGMVEQFAHLASIAIERTHAQEALRRSEAYLAEAQRLSLTGSFGWSLGTGEIVWSAETFCIMGYDRATKPTLELVLDRVHPADVILVQQTLERAKHVQEGFDFEHRLLMPDGKIKHVHVVARVTNAGPGAVEFVGAVMDITEWKNSQEATYAAKARFEGILEIAEDAIISVDSAQRIVLFNQGAEKVFGYPPGEVIGQSLDMLIPARFLGVHKKHIKDFATSGEVSRLMGQRREVFGRRKDGSEFPAEASISKLNLGGEITFTVILRDITERKKAAEALRASEHLARGQLEALARSLAALSRESVPEKFLEHVLRIAGEQLDAVGASVWEMSDQHGCVDLAANYQNGVLHLPARSEGAPPLQLSDGTAEHPVWTEFFRTGKHCVYGVIQNEPPWSQVAFHPDGPWHDWRSGMVDNPIVPQMIKDIAAAGIVATLNVPMSVADKVTGLFVLCFKQRRAFRQDEIELTRAMANQAMLAVQLMRLSQANRESAVIAERNRMARDMHDTLAQGFTGVIVQLEAAQEAMSQNLDSKVSEHLDRAGDLARESLREARRSVRALRPQALEELSLGEALARLIRRMTENTAVQAVFYVLGEPRELASDWEENLLRIGQEVLANALRHAQATEFKAQLEFQPGEVRLNLRDDGQGFDPAGRHDGFGLQGMRERVEGMGGRLTVQSAKGEGTAISIVLPLASSRKLAAP